MADRHVRLLSLGRDEAKQVFSKKDPAALRDWIDSLWQDNTRLDSRRNIHLGIDVASYTALIESSPSLDAAAKSLLLRGGRLLPSSEDAPIYLIRPDMVGPLSLAAASIEKLGGFLTAAAGNGEAIVIAY